MKAIIKFLKTTLVGGVFVLLPVAVLVILISKILTVVHKIALPLAKWIPYEQIDGEGKILLIQIFVIIIFCFLAGLLYKARIVKKSIESIESNILSRIPGYSYLKMISEGAMGDEENAMKEVVLAKIGGGWRIGFVTERLSDGMVMIFIPNSPGPWSGSIYLMPEEEIRKLDISIADAFAIIKRSGIDSREVLNEKSTYGL